jgi:hypothetical protein
MDKPEALITPVVEMIDEVREKQGKNILLSDYTYLARTGWKVETYRWNEFKDGYLRIFGE